MVIRFRFGLKRNSIAPPISLLCNRQRRHSSYYNVNVDQGNCPSASTRMGEVVPAYAETGLHYTAAWQAAFPLAWGGRYGRQTNRRTYSCRDSDCTKSCCHGLTEACKAQHSEIEILHARYGVPINPNCSGDVSWRRRRRPPAGIYIWGGELAISRVHGICLYSHQMNKKFGTATPIRAGTWAYTGRATRVEGSRGPTLKRTRASVLALSGGPAACGRGGRQRRDLGSDMKPTHVFGRQRSLRRRQSAGVHNQPA